MLRSERAITQAHVDGVGLVVAGISLSDWFTDAPPRRERFGWPVIRRWPTSTSLACRRAPAWRGSPARVSPPVRRAQGLYVGDKFAVDPWTFNLGLRFDRRTREIVLRARALTGCRDRLPRSNTPADPFDMEGALAAFEAPHRLTDRTLVRVSYGRFGSQLHWASTAAVENPAGISFIDAPSMTRMATIWHRRQSSCGPPAPWGT